MKSAHTFRRVFAVASLLAAVASAYAGDSLVPADGLKWCLPSGATIEDGILTIDVPPGESGISCATAPLDQSQCPDGFIAEIAASGNDVSKAPAPWLGLKFMVHYKDPEMGIDCYPDLVSRPTGTFSSTTLKLVDNFPGRVRQNPVLYLGLQGCSGKVVFDLSSLRLLKAEPAFAKVNQDYVVAYPKKMASPGSLRGFMLPYEPTEQDFKDMAAMSATLVRYQMTRNTRGFDESRHLDFAAYRDWLEGRLAKLDEILAWGERCCIEVVVDMHYTPGGVEKRGLRINYLRDCIDLFREYGWDWTYHAFRESPCWDVEKEGPDIKHMVPSPDTPRKQALLEGLNR